MGKLGWFMSCVTTSPPREGELAGTEKGREDEEEQEEKKEELVS